MANIMVVDDAVFVRLTLKKIIEEAGHTVVAEADGGVIALEEYDRCKPDIVFLDITMPEVSGIEVLSQIKEKDPKAKVIMCSSMGQPAYLAESIERGALDFVVKPFKPEQVVAAIEKILKK